MNSIKPILHRKSMIRCAISTLTFRSESKREIYSSRGRLCCLKHARSQRNWNIQSSALMPRMQHIYWPDFDDLCAVFFAVCGCVSMPSAACRVIEWPLHRSAAQISADTTGMHAVNHTLPFDRVHNFASKSIRQRSQTIRLDCLTLAQSLAKMALVCVCECVRLWRVAHSMTTKT